MIIFKRYINSIMEEQSENFNIEIHDIDESENVAYITLYYQYLKYNKIYIIFLFLFLCILLILGLSAYFNS